MATRRAKRIIFSGVRFPLISLLVCGVFMIVTNLQAINWIDASSMEHSDHNSLAKLVDNAIPLLPSKDCGLPAPLLFNNNTHHIVNSINLDHPPPNTVEDFDIVHSVLTRFMVGQPGHATLARARYWQFQTFCFPTMANQTHNNFYWMVLADPRLDPAVLQDLKCLLSTMPNAYMILTTNTTWVEDGVGVKGVSSYGLDLVDLARMVADENQKSSFRLETGDVTYLKQLVQLLDPTQKSASKNKMILKLETLLDADDGLHNRGIEWIQQNSINHARHQQQLASFYPTLNSTWWHLCATQHMEWHNREVYQLDPEEYNKKGISSGILGYRVNPRLCVSAGHTRIGQLRLLPNATISIPTSFPQDALVNHGLIFNSPRCNTTTTSACWKREFPGINLVLKTRAVTSDSLDHLNPQVDDYRDNHNIPETDAHPLHVNESDHLWTLLQDEFSVSRHDAWQTSVYMHDHVTDIIGENGESRCTPGFPCNRGPRKALMQLRFHLKMRDGRTVVKHPRGEQE